MMSDVFLFLKIALGFISLKVLNKLIADNLPPLDRKSLIKYGKTALMYLTTAVATLMVGIWFISRSKEEKAVIALIVTGVIIAKMIIDQINKEEKQNKPLTTSTQMNLLFPNS